MRIGFAGCSHSTISYGKSWAHHMIDDIQPNYQSDVTVSGASNEMLIEKIKIYLEMYGDYDLFVIQLTDPSRMLFGLSGNDVTEEMKNLFSHLPYDPNADESICSWRTTNRMSYYNFTVNSQDRDLNVLINKNYQISNAIRDHFLLSDYNLKIKIFHTLMTYKTLFEHYKTKVIFFSWFVDLYKLAKEVGYIEILKEFNILEGCVLDFIKEKKLQPVKPDDLHYGTEEHKIIYDEYLKDFIYKNIKL